MAERLRRWTVEQTVSRSVEVAAPTYSEAVEVASEFFQGRPVDTENPSGFPTSSIDEDLDVTVRLLE